MNENPPAATMREMEAAIAAGGITWDEIKRLGLISSLADTHYHDGATNLYIPKGVLLFRSRPKAAQPSQLERDTLSIP